MRIAIIGAGLAGTSLAYILKQNGLEPVIYDTADTIASGASGNEVGLYNPRFTAEKSPEQEFYAAGYFKVLEICKNLDADLNPCGTLHLVTDEKKAKRFPQTVKNWEWGEENMRMISASEATHIAGVEISKPCIYLPKSGTISPRKLCQVYAQNVETHLHARIDDLSGINADKIILAAGMGCLKFAECNDLALKPVRGQITYAKALGSAQNLNCAVAFGGYVAPVMKMLHCIGSSFQPWLDHNEIIPQDDTDNLEKLYASIPAMQSEHEVTGHRAAVRTTARDHFPVIGQLAENLYISTAHGSHGILSSLIGAEIIADKILNKQGKYSQSLYKALSPLRF